MPLRAAKDQQKNGDPGPGNGTAVIARAKPQTRRPNMYRVLLLNDDYTPMEFVVVVLRKYFNKAAEGGDAYHAPCPPAWRRRMRYFHLRGC